MLIDVQNQMYEGGVRGNYSQEGNLHLTLAFIGEYQDSESVMDALENVSFTPFEIAVEGFGNFGSLWWAGIQDNPALKSVVRRLHRSLLEAQIPFDKKAFRPHITLIRKAELRNGVPEITYEKTGMLVNSISLMKSERGRKGMIYTEIGVLNSNQDSD